MGAADAADAADVGAMVGAGPLEPRCSHPPVTHALATIPQAMNAAARVDRGTARWVGRRSMGRTELSSNAGRGRKTTSVILSAAEKGLSWLGSHLNARGQWGNSRAGASVWRACQTWRKRGGAARVGGAESGRKALGEGAAQAAPTAPHATPHGSDTARSGPERFWSRWPDRVAFGAFILVSGVAHFAVVPFEWPHAFQVNDAEGEAAIPVDLLAPDEAPPAPPPSLGPIEPESAQSRRDMPGAGPTARADAGAPRDGGVDAGAEVSRTGRDAGPPDASADGSTNVDAYDGGASDAAVAMLADSGPGSGPRDPQAIIGAAGAVQADVVLVMLVVNAEVIRTNRVGARMGYLLRGIPQWDEFMSGTDIDPVRDTDWVIISGPSLINTARDVVLIHYAASDAAVDRAISVVTRKYEHGGPYDTGVAGVKASLAHADRAERVLLRPQPHVLAVVPPSVAGKVARQLVSARTPAHVRPGEALYLRLVNPHHPMPEVPESITEMRLRVVPRADGGADVFIDGDTKDADAAARAAQDMRALVRRHNDTLTSLITHGLFDHVEVKSEGPEVMLHLVVTLDQIETLATLVGDFLGVQAPATPASPPAGGDRRAPPR